MDSANDASDFENTEPMMTISSETVKVSEGFDNCFELRLRNRSISPQKSTSTVKSHRSLRSSARSTSSVDSQESVETPVARISESDRLKAFLGTGGTQSRSSSTHSQSSVTNDRLLESDCKKQTLSMPATRSRTPSVSSCDSFGASAFEESDRLRAFLSASNSSNTNNGQLSAAVNNGESDRLKRFLQPQLATTDSTLGKSNSNYRHKQSKKPTKTKPKETKSKKPGKKYSKLVESDRLKRFLETDSISKSELSFDSDGSDDSLDKTLVPANHLQESKRLQEFLGTDSKCSDAISNHSRSSSSSPVTVTQKPKESRKLRAFLGEAVSSRESSPELTQIKMAEKRGNSDSSSRSKHSGLSQEIDGMCLTNGRDDMSSPPKRRFIADDFNFDSDNESNSRTTTSTSAAVTSNKVSSDDTLSSSTAKNLKPVINFEKMEGRSKAGPKPVTKKLLGTPGTVIVLFLYLLLLLSSVNMMNQDYTSA